MSKDTEGLGYTRSEMGSFGKVYDERTAPLYTAPPAAPQSVPAQPVAIYQQAYPDGMWRDVTESHYKILSPYRRRIVYTAPPAAKQDVPRALTDDEIKRIYTEQTGFDMDACDAAVMEFARAILAKAGAK